MHSVPPPANTQTAANFNRWISMHTKQTSAPIFDQSVFTDFQFQTGIWSADDMLPICPLITCVVSFFRENLRTPQTTTSGKAHFRAPSVNFPQHIQICNFLPPICFTHQAPTPLSTPCWPTGTVRPLLILLILVISWTKLKCSDLPPRSTLFV